MTITHPFHPLRGQQVEIIRIRRGTDPHLIVRLPDGIHAAIAVDWTDYATPSDLEPPSVPPHLLDFDGLCQVVQFIDRIRQRGQKPASDGEDKHGTPAGDEL